MSVILSVKFEPIASDLYQSDQFSNEEEPEEIGDKRSIEQKTEAKDGVEPIYNIKTQTIQDTSEEVLHCLFCFAEFSNDMHLQAHLATQQHPPFDKMLERSYFMFPRNRCLVCSKNVNADESAKHRCAEKLSQTLHRNEQELFERGSPLTCILCTGTQLYSYHHLMIHIIVRHGFEKKLVHREKNPCPLCYAPFKTDKANVIEFHCVKEHMPEIYLEHLRDMQPEGSPNVVMKPYYSCRIPAKLCHSERIDKRHCSESFTTLPKMIAHLQSSHAPIPLKSLKQGMNPLTCRHCMFTFTYSTELYEHIKRKHEFILWQRANYVESQEKLPKDLNELTCNFCWHKFKTIFHLQIHIQASHINSWRRCGICGREYSKFYESRSSKLLYMEMMAHERLHVRQLEAYASKASRIMLGEGVFDDTPCLEITENYFGRIDLNAAQERRKVGIRDYSQEFAAIGKRNKAIQHDMILMGTL